MDEEPKEKSIKKPEFIIIDDTRAYLQHSTKREESYDEFFERAHEEKPVEAVRPQGFFRMISAFAAIISFWLALGNLFLAALAAVFATLFLFQNNELNSLCKRFWTLFKVFLVCIIGFVMGVFNPALGIGIVMLYLSLSSEAVSPFMNTLLKRMSEKL